MISNSAISDMDKQFLADKPLVTIRCLAYNQELYIRQCLEGFIMQKTNFRFEAIVHDDASTDGTAMVIREYAQKYPDIIKPIYETENQYSKHDGTLTKIMNAHMKGKYIAMCEGDDYWTDPLKLQKQVDFLESHPDYSMCFHAATLKWEKNEHIDSLFYKVKDREYFGTEIFKHWIVATASVVFRSNILDSEFYKKAWADNRFLYRDNLLFLCASKLGRIYGMKEVMSVYRKHEGGAVYSHSFEREMRANISDIAVYEVFGDKFKQIVNNLILV